MADIPNRTKQYTDAEVGAMLKRATELQEQAGLDDHTLSLAEIEQIAGEIGIDPAFLHVAATEASQKSNNSSGSLTGAPFSVEAVRVAAGEMSEAQWVDVVQEIRRSLGETGLIAEIGRSREWSRFVGEGDGGVNFSSSHASVRPAKGQTTIELRRSVRGLAFLGYPIAVVVGLLLPEVIFDGLALTTLEKLAILTGSVGGGVGSVRLGIGLWIARAHRRIADLADRIQQIVEQDSTPVNALQEEPTVDLLKLPVEEEQHAPVSERARIRS